MGKENPKELIGVDFAKESELLGKSMNGAKEDEKKKAAELLKQRAEFEKDESYFDDYKGLVIDGRNVLVRMFVFKWESVSKGKILMPKKKIDQSKSYSWSDTTYDERILPIAKVIKVGSRVENENLKEGSIILLPYNEVEGYEDNPEFIMHLQYSKAQGLDPLYDQLSIPQQIPKIRKNWDRHIFKHPNNLEPTDTDLITFLLPETKVMATFATLL